MASRNIRRPQNRRLRRDTAADYVLEVTTKSTSARRRRRRRVWGWIFRVVLLALIGVGAFYGAMAAFDRFFYSNPDYTLSRIDLELADILTREEALQETGLSEGANIFAVDLAKVETSLRAIPMVKDVRIERQLPGTISIRLESRQPVAWVAAEGETPENSVSPNTLLVDASGILMRPRRVRPEFLHLPVIYGVQSDNIRDGEPLHSEDLRVALSLIAEVAARPDSLLKIRSIDISRGYAMEVISDQNARILIAAADLPSQLERLQKLLLHCVESGRALDSVNLMVRRNTPVKFVMVAAAPPESPESPASRKSKSSRN